MAVSGEQGTGEALGRATPFNEVLDALVPSRVFQDEEQARPPVEPPRRGVARPHRAARARQLDAEQTAARRLLAAVASVRLAVRVAEAEGQLELVRVRVGVRVRVWAGVRVRVRVRVRSGLGLGLGLLSQLHLLVERCEQFPARSQVALVLPPDLVSGRGGEAEADAGTAAEE